MVFTAILPLLGTWVGAVLAFYFSQDNLQAASTTTLNAVRTGKGLPSDTFVTDVMTPAAQINPLSMVADDNAPKSPIA